MRSRLFLPLLGAMASPGLALAAAAAQPPVAPAPATADARIRYVDYRVDAVTLIPVQRGVATRIVLAADEHILRDGAGTGYAADCNKNELDWCMRADAGGNQVLIRPKPGATSNNLELRTDKRDYSFRFEVLSDAAPGPRAKRHAVRPLPAYRVIFRYPPAATEALAGGVPPPASAAELIRDARPAPRNWLYTMQALAGGEDIAPTLVFDDGRFTYLQFAANRELPTVYYIGAGGQEARVNFHIAAHDASLLVVERVAPRLVLRLGAAVVGLWNDADANHGVPPRKGTTIDGLVRELQQGEP